MGTLSNENGDGRGRGPQALRENPNNHLRMTSGKKFGPETSHFDVG